MAEVILKNVRKVYPNTESKKKKKKDEKGYDFCIVRSGDSMHTIAQRYGIRLKNLYKMNKLPDDYTPSVGDTLRLR